ncbi:MAG: SigB/SigF/SigG family RNA polymerase sigma factor [Actinomycetota bacterium]
MVEKERLSAERVEELFDALPDRRAQDEIVMGYKPLATYLARRFGGRGEEQADLDQVAVMALVKAVGRFDPEREVKFSTFASVTVVGELKRHLRDKSWAMSVPRRVKESSLAVDKADRELSQELGRSPTVSEISRHAGLSEEDVLEGMEASNAYSTSSLDVPVEEGGNTLSSFLGREDEALALTDSWVSAKAAIDQLAPRQRQLLFMRFFKEMTQTQIAQEINISQMHVSRLLAQAIQDLRSKLQVDK